MNVYSGVQKAIRRAQYNILQRQARQIHGIFRIYYLQLVPLKLLLFTS